MFLLNVSDTADQYIATESIKLLSIFGVAGGWIIAALILAAVFWKAGEERWKAYVPVYKWVLVFRLASLPSGLGLLGLVPWGFGLLSSIMGSGTSLLLLWFQFFAALAGPLPAILTLVNLIGSSAPVGAVLLSSLAGITGLIFQALYGYAVYRIGMHLQREGLGWLVLSMLLPVVSLIIFAADKSIWHDDEELGWDAGKIGAAVPPARW